MASKEPWFAWFAADWLNDPALSLCAPATRGVWADLLSAMHLAGRVGSLSGTHAQLARLARCTPDEMAHACSDLQTTGAANISTSDNGVVTVLSRRKQREAQRLQSDRARQVAHRERNSTADCHSDVTPMSRDIVKRSRSHKVKNPNGQIQGLERSLAPPFEFDQQKVEGAEWLSMLTDFSRQLAAGNEDRRIVAQLAWLVCAGAPILANVRDALDGITAIRKAGKPPTKPVAYLRTCLVESLGSENLESLLKIAPSRDECAKLLEGL